MNKRKGLVFGGLLVVGLFAKHLWSLSQLGDLLSFNVSSFKIHKISKGNLLDVSSYKILLKIKLRIINGSDRAISNVKIGLIKMYYSGLEVAYSKPTNKVISIPANDISEFEIMFECPLSSSSEMIKDVTANLLNMGNLTGVLKKKMTMNIAASVNGVSFSKPLQFN